MLRGKLKEKFGKSEEQPASTEGPNEQSVPDETIEEVHQEEQDEATSVRNFLRFMSSFRFLS